MIKNIWLQFKNIVSTITALKDYWIIKRSGLFDSNYYLSSNPDVLSAGINPLHHYVTYGWKEGRKPNTWFDTSLVAVLNKTFQKLNKNPLSSYITTFRPRAIQSIQQNNETCVVTVENGEYHFRNIYQVHYENEVADINQNEAPSHICYQAHENIKDPTVKAIAFYLPYSHSTAHANSFEKEDQSYWTPVIKAKPQFLGHYQPHYPGELGCYDLRIKAIQERQVDLAKNYGLFGFCFYFCGDTELGSFNEPLEQYLANELIDFPFCLCWVNGSSISSGTGLDEVMPPGEEKTKEEMGFIDSIEKYVTRKNYIRINDGLMLMILRPDLIKNPCETLKIWRGIASERGWGKLHLVACQRSMEVADLQKMGFDGIVESPPYIIENSFLPTVNEKVWLLNKAYQGKIHDYCELINYSYNNSNFTNLPIYKTVVPSWDSEPGKPGSGVCLHNSNPASFYTWLKDAMLYSTKRNNLADKHVFIYAWNDWINGSHLEPDIKSGYAFLERTYQALREPASNPPVAHLFREPSSQAAVVIHMYYPDLANEIASLLSNIEFNYDLFISLPIEKANSEQEIKRIFPNARIFQIINRGRDILSFVQLLPGLIENKYKVTLKIHTKKSLHIADGDIWRNYAYAHLLGSKKITNAAYDALLHTDIGLIGPKKLILPLGIQGNSAQEALKQQAHINKLCSRYDVIKTDFYFVAGSMFWFKPDVFRDLAYAGLEEYDFEPELGQVSWTMAHAIEGSLGLLASSKGAQLAEISLDGKIRIPTNEELMQRKPFRVADLLSEVN